jgi:hypothetical protein
MRKSWFKINFCCINLQKSRLILKMKKNNLQNNSGQIFILSMLILGGSLLAASVIGGYLMLLHIRQSTDSMNSAKAIYAADSGIEWELWQNNVTDEFVSDEISNGDAGLNFGNGASFRLKRFPTSTQVIGSAPGGSGRTVFRSLRIIFGE